MDNSREPTIQQQIAEAVYALAEPVLTQAGLELIDVEYQREQQGMVLRFTIDKPGGINVDDCTDVSRVIGDILDVKDPIPGRYHLEVSSPGINRPLKRPADFARFAGQDVLIRTSAPLNGKRTFRGRLEGYGQDGMIRLTTGGEEFRIPLDQVAKARLDIL